MNIISIIGLLVLGAGIGLMALMALGNFEQKKSALPNLDLAKGDKPAPAPDKIKELVRGVTAGSARQAILFAVGALLIWGAWHFGGANPEGILGKITRAVEAIGFVFVAMAAIDRLLRIAVPYLDKRALIKTASAEPQAAAIVVGAQLVAIALLGTAALNYIAFK